MSKRKTSVSAKTTGSKLGPSKSVLNALVRALQKGELDTLDKKLPNLLRLHPQSAVLLNLSGALALTREDHAQAAQIFFSVTKLAPKFIDGHKNLGVALLKLGRADSAIKCFATAAQLDPNDIESFIKLAGTLRATRQFDAAIGAYQRALALDPKNETALVETGKILNLLSRHEEAVGFFSRALEVDPKNADAYESLAYSLESTKQIEAAVQVFDKVLELSPELARAAGFRMYLKMQLCDWSSWDEDQKALGALGMGGNSVRPLTVLAAEDAPERHLARAKTFTQFQQTGQFVPRPAGLSTQRPEKLRVGYMSADYRTHAVMHLMKGFFREIDHSRFEVYAYNYGTNPDDFHTEALRGQVAKMIDMRPMSDAEAIERLKADKLDIAIDLNGHTAGTRFHLMAKRFAPLQMSFLGFPASTGTPFIDYMIVDPHIAPEETRQAFVENLIYMPHSYLPSDNQRVVAKTAKSRAHYGLPEEGFVFCSFNNTYKISPAEFDVWMRLLQGVEGSVLWLSERNVTVSSNLKKEAEKRGIDPARVIFAALEPKMQDHLARQRHADLFLDTFTYNAHTTGSDALWVGLPLVTMAGRQFAARVGKSLLNAVNLPELVTHSVEDYEALALALARDPARLADIKARLQDGLAKKPLFDTAQFSRDFERGLDTAYQLYLEGKAPQDIRLD